MFENIHKIYENIQDNKDVYSVICTFLEVPCPLPRPSLESAKSAYLWKKHPWLGVALLETDNDTVPSGSFKQLLCS